jgi:hypothetical protein
MGLGGVWRAPEGDVRHEHEGDERQHRQEVPEVLYDRDSGQAAVREHAHE